MNKRIKNFFAILLAVCTILTQGSIVTFATEVNSRGIELTGALINIPNCTPVIGEQVQCEIMVYPEGAEYTSATWWSSDTSIATIDQNGLVTTVGIGTAEIHLKLESDYGTLERMNLIYVQPILGTSVVLNQTEAELNVGDTIQLSGTVSPENTTDKTITWSSTNERVATVDANGLVTAVGPGEAYIIAECGWGAEDCHITVYETTEKSGVDLYKNDVLIGNYATLNEAFDLMTDQAADYDIILNEEQVLYGYAQWPKVNSIKFMPYGYAVCIYLTEKNTTFNSDVCFNDWVGILPPGSDKESVIYDINIQDYTVTFDCEVARHYITVGDAWFIAGFNFKGGENSKMVFTTGTQFWNSSIQVDTVEFLTTQRNGEITYGFMTLYQCPKENIINKLIITDPNERNYHVNSIDVRGYTDLNALLEIKDINFNAQYHTKRVDISAEGYADIVIYNADSDIDMFFQYDPIYWGERAPRTSSISYLGNDVRSIDVSVSFGSNGTWGPEEVYNPIEPDKVLLYAPNVASEKIEFMLGKQQEIGNRTTEGYFYSGSLLCENGYYYGKNMPTIMMDRIAYVAEGACSDTVYYELKNRKEDLQSVKWEVQSLDYPFDGTGVTITDFDKTHVDFTLSETDKDYRLIGTFDYGYGQAIVDIPIFMSAPVSNAALSEDEIFVEYGDSRIVYKSIELSYAGEETPKIILAASDRTVINQLALFGNTIQVSVTGPGTSVLYVYVGDAILKCNFTVVDKLSLPTPTISSLSNQTNGVKIVWNAVESAKKYRIYRRAETENNWKEVGNTTGTIYTDTTVKSGVSYFYAVRGVKGDENPNISKLNETGKKIQYIAAPSITALESKASGVQINWDFVDGATGYIVYRREPNGVFQKIAGFTDGKTKSYVDKNVVDGKAYFYAVKAINGTNQSNYITKGINYKATLATPTFTVANVAGGVQIKWDFVDEATGYIVYRREPNGVFQKIAGYTDGKTKGYTDTNVVDGKAYFYAVKAINAKTQSTYTTKGINYKASLKAPTFTVANVANGVQIKWDFVDGATGYIVYRREAGGVFQKIAGYTDGKTKSYVDKDVVDGKAYFYAVKAISSTSQSTYITKGINYKATLAAPEFTVTNVSGGVQIKWDFVHGATGYIVYRREPNGVFQKIAGFTDGITKSYVDTNVENGKAYFYAVKAINGPTQSTYTTKGINYKASLATPQFTVNKVTDGVQINWNFVDDATGYIIYRREENGTFSKIAGFTDGKTKSYVDKTAVKGTTYYYAVKAINSSKQSAYDSVQITP